MAFGIPEGSKFACLALENASVSRDLQDPMELSRGRWVLFSPPVEFDDSWKTWLGSLQVQHLQRSNLLLFSVVASQRPEILDGENSALEIDVQRMFYAILLNGIPHHEAAVLLSGSNSGGKTHIRQVRTLNDHIRPRHVRPFRISREHLQACDTVADGMEDFTTERRGDFLRAGYGFYALRRAIMEYRAEERLHQFVRATEALVRVPIGGSRRVFAHRCQLFVGNTNAGRCLAGELYDLRSAAEHMNSFEDVLGEYPPPQHEAIALKRVYEAQLIASYAYKRLASEAIVRRYFRDDGNIDGFWKLPWRDQRRIWGPHLDLAETVNANWVEPVQGH